jgi:2-C-methyl-D-erythritol 4-phosphate cytidylyltransferase
MSAWKLTAAVLVAVCLYGTRTLASETEHDERTAAAPHRHAAPLAVKHADTVKAKKAPAVKRTPARDRTTDLELPQLG